MKKGDKVPVTPILGERGESAKQAAKLVGAGHTYVSDAKRIVAKDVSAMVSSELRGFPCCLRSRFQFCSDEIRLTLDAMLERIRDGEVTIQEAKRQLGFAQSSWAREHCYGAACYGSAKRILTESPVGVVCDTHPKQRSMQMLDMAEFLV